MDIWKKMKFDPRLCQVMQNDGWRKGALYDIRKKLSLYIF